jgi:hypothetical protein
MDRSPPTIATLRTIKTLKLLELISRLGAATPEQIAALVARTTVDQVPMSSCIQIEQRLSRLARQELVSVTAVETWYLALRNHEGWLYRLTNAGRCRALGSSGRIRRVLTAVHGAADPALDGWSDELVVWEAAFPGIAAAHAVRARLTAAVKAGYLERRATRPLKRVPVVSLTAPGEQRLTDWRRTSFVDARAGVLAPTRVPRPDQVVHHLLAVSAAIQVLHASGAEFVRLLGDEDLRSSSRQGRVLTRGETDMALPDARLAYRRSGTDAVSTADIEILVGSYANAKIVEKYRRLPPGTLYFAPTALLQDRVAALDLPRPHLVV